MLQASHAHAHGQSNHWHHDKHGLGSVARPGCAPAPWPVTLLAGQPQLRSTRGAWQVCARCAAAAAMSSGLDPMIWAPSGSGWAATPASSQAL